MTYSLNIDDLAIVIHMIARDHGFWDKPRNLGEMLMLATSELTEALEEDRGGKPVVYFKCTTCNAESLDLGDAQGRHAVPNSIMICDGVPFPKPEGALVEIVDAIIRLLDTGQDLADRSKYDIGEVMELKMEFNAQREHMHGKKY